MSVEGAGDLGSREAQRRIASCVDEHRSQLLAYARSVLGGHHESAAQGVVQDAVIVFLLNGTVLPEDEEEALASLFVHIKNVGRNRRRREGRRSGPPLEEAVPVASGPEDPADALLRRITILQRLEEAIRQLPKGQAEVFRMRCIEGLSYAEIAERRGRTVKSVRNLDRRARIQLRELVADLRHW